MKRRPLVGGYTILAGLPGLLGIGAIFQESEMPASPLWVTLLAIVVRGGAGIAGGILLILGRRLGYFLSIVSWMYLVALGAVVLVPILGTLGEGVPAFGLANAMFYKDLTAAGGKVLFGSVILFVLIRDLAGDPGGRGLA